MNTPPTDIESSHSFSTRAFHLDLRVQVLTPKALHDLATELSSLDYNTLIIEWEATFPYSKHVTISNESAYSPTEVRDFLDHCKHLNLKVIPLQQAFGHVEYILRHPRYAELREDERDRCQFCARKIPEVRTLVKELLEDIKEFHDSGWIHLGGDETYLLGHCENCSAFSEKQGLSRLYTEFMTMLLDEAKDAGLRPIIWADMLLKHPECLATLPQDTVLIDWNYGRAPDHFGPPSKLLEAGFEVWGAGSLRSHPDNHSTTCWKRHFKNIEEFIPRARRDRYAGMILTSWSTSGLHGYEWDDDWEVLNLLPIRRLYPLNGFRILLVAFATAVCNSGEFDPKSFILEYTKKRFDLSEAQSREFCNSLLEPSKHDSCISQISPKRNKKEFAHIALTEQFSLLRARFDKIANAVQSTSHNRSKVPALASELESLIKHSDRLEAEYSKAAKDYITDADIQADSRYRQAAMKNLMRTMQP